jgi:hypothetical protein
VKKLPTTLLSALILLFMAIGMIACTEPQEEESAILNQEITSHEGEPILVGPITRAGLEQGTYNTWFSSEYSNYSLDSISLDSIGDRIAEVSVAIYLGTWCSDTQREVPRFFKLLDYLNYDSEKVTLIGLDNHPDRDLQSPGGEEKGKDINYVPTFIFSKDGHELGRIIETPNETLEIDLLRILATQKTG